MDFLPIFFDIRGKRCLVVGGNEIAARKTALLLHAGASVMVAAPALAAAFKELSAQDRLSHHPGAFDPHLLDGMALVIAAHEDFAMNRAVSEAAKARQLPVNVVDTPALCSFVLPSIIDRSPILIAVSSGGASPVLARMLRARLETLIPAAYGLLATLAGQFRDKVKQRFARPENRRIFWEKVFQGPIAEMVFAGQDQAAQHALDDMLAQETEAAKPMGEVYLVGGGPGNPDLLTFRALRLMQQADVVVHDNLVTPAVLDMARRDAERIYVGKQRDNHALPQEGINELLVRLAKEGKRVLRLKGGDPFIFGRGGEEAEAARAAGVPVEVVPGISAANGAAAAAQIALTHRDASSIVSYVAGQCKGLEEQNWAGLAGKGRTLVIYMGVKTAPQIAEKLMEDGLAPDMPVAVIENGTRPDMRVLRGLLAGLPELVENEKVVSPALIVIGEVTARDDITLAMTAQEVAQ